MPQEPVSRVGRLNLDTIGSRYGTDKAAGHHGYLHFYERFFQGMRDDAICLLEIGVAKGNSIRMWREYFPSARIIGVDIDQESRQYANDRILIEIADQSNIADLVRLGVKYGPFDIVVDDGSHFWNHQITTLQYLFPFVKPGGFFVVEDIDTSFGEAQTIYQGNATVSAVRYLQKLSDYVVADAQLDASAEEDAFIRSFARETEFIAFHRRTAVLRRRTAPIAPEIPNEMFLAPTPLLAPTPPLAREPAAGGAAQISITVHLPGRGDVKNERALVGGVRGSRKTIQGFFMQRAQGAPEELQYKALLHNKVWSEWVPSGTYVGTRGAGLSIRGFAVRLRGELARQFVCACTGAFVDHADLVQAGDGAECLAPNFGELEAIQVVLRPRLPAHAITP